MGRNLVLCFDGTNNEYAATNTNVVKLYAMLERAKPDQLAYYQTGIGTVAPAEVWGKVAQYFTELVNSAIAWLLVDHVTAGYRFLMRYYQDGDDIFIFGFSRGAYTARALAAMLYKVGLLTQGNEELIPFAWGMFKRERNPELYTGFRYTFARKVKIKFLGLWDTVSSVGWMWEPQYLQFTANNPAVEVVRHAVALDERRAYFPQNLWGHEPPTDAIQVWFPGVHCDVGGGYKEPQAGLSKIALKWMVGEAKRFGLRFQPKSEAANLPPHDTKDAAAPSATAMMHQSLRGRWWLAEILPKRYRDPAAGFAERWMLHLGRPRHVNDGANIHTSVLERMKQVTTYKPPNLPGQFTEIR